MLASAGSIMRITLRQTVALRVADMRERETLRRRSHATQLAITCAHELIGPFDRRATATDLHERPNEISNHMMQKGIRAKL